MTAARKLVDPQQYYHEEVVPAAKPKSTVRRRRLPATLKILLTAAVCVVVSLLYLQQQVTSYYLNLELVRLQEQVKLMEQRNDHLMLSLESQRSLKQIEQIARTSLGMVEPEYTATVVVPELETTAPAAEGVWLAAENQEKGIGEMFAALASWVNKVLPLGGVEAGTLRR